MRPQPVKCDVVYIVQYRSDISINFPIEGLEWSVGRLLRGNCMNNSYGNIGRCILPHVEPHIKLGLSNRLCGNV